MKSPFKFLDAYTKTDKDIFFGRDVEVEELYDRVFETNLVLLYGASGTGKTSIINCGLANMFENTDWLPIHVRRKKNIIDSLHDCLDRYSVSQTYDKTEIKKKIKSIYLDHFKPIYLIFDQFEELFVLGSEPEQIVFFEVLRELVEEGLQCKILLSMREEYIAYLSAYEVIIPTLFDNRQRIEKMGTLQLQEVIKGTTEAFGIAIEEVERVVDQIILKLRDPKEGVELSSLQVYLDSMYRKAVGMKLPDEPVVFSPELIDETGQFEDVIEVFLREQVYQIEEELKAKGSKVKGIPTTVLFSLVTEDGTKKAIEADSIYKLLFKRKGITKSEIDYCIQRFQELRILQEVT